MNLSILYMCIGLIYSIDTNIYIYIYIPNQTNITLFNNNIDIHLDFCTYIISSIFIQSKCLFCNYLCIFEAIESTKNPHNTIKKPSKEESAQTLGGFKNSSARGCWFFFQLFFNFLNYQKKSLNTSWTTIVVTIHATLVFHKLVSPMHRGTFAHGCFQTDNKTLKISA